MYQSSPPGGGSRGRALKLCILAAERGRYRSLPRLRQRLAPILLVAAEETSRVGRPHEIAQGSERRRLICRLSASATVASCGAFRAIRPKSTRQRKTMLVATPWRRQICAPLAPG